MLVVLGIVAVLLGIFIPYVISVRENGSRTRCADKLRQIRDALYVYVAQNGNNYPRVRYDEQHAPVGYAAFTGPDAHDPFAADSAVQSNDVTASLWLLVRSGIVADAGVFVCPSTNDVRERVVDRAGRAVTPRQRGNFRGGANLSYSYASPFSNAPNYRPNRDFLLADFALVADKNPGRRGSSDVTASRWDAPPLELSRGNSLNHGRVGQNVLFGDGSVKFETTPYCGVGRPAGAGGDNIYTARARVPATQASDLPFDVNGSVGNHIGPAASDDMLDVTPLSLGIETLGGVMTTLISRNTTIPTKKSEVFSTATDSQPSVEVHVLQGERPMARDNRTLGRFQLTGLPPAPRGVPQIEVAFDIDANGIVSVKAVDKATGKEQAITISGASGLSKDEVDRMVKDAESHAADDQARRETIDARNQADALIYQVEKTLGESKAKLGTAEVSRVEAALDAARQAVKGDDANAIRSATTELQQASHAMAEALYQASSQAPGSRDQASGGGDVKEGEVVDAA